MTVDWRGDVAHCTYPDCDRTSADDHTLTLVRDEQRNHWLPIGLSGATAATVRQVWIPDEGQDFSGLVLLTSDGVHDQVPHDRLVDLLREHTDPQALADAIVAAATADETGYRDDATVVVLKHQDPADHA